MEKLPFMLKVLHGIIDAKFGEEFQMVLWSILKRKHKLVRNAYILTWTQYVHVSAPHFDLQLTPCVTMTRPPLLCATMALAW